MEVPHHGPPHRRSEHNSDATLPSSKRAKIRLACQECRDRKIRCDGARPTCRSCCRKKLGPERCVYLAVDTESPDGYITRLEDRIKQLEALLGSRDKTPNEPAAVEPRVIANAAPATDRQRAQIHDAQGPVEPLEDQDSPSFLGSSSAVGFMSEVCRTFKAAGRGLSAADDHPGSPGSREGDISSNTRWFEPPSRQNDEYQVLMAECVVPPKRVADSLLEHYWNGAHPLQPFVHRDTFMERYEELWNNSTLTGPASRTRQSVQLEQIFHCNLNLMFALGCRFRSMSAGKQRQGSNDSHVQFASRATRLLTLDLLDCGTVQLVQALNLMAQYLQTLSMSNKCWIIVGTAIRVAQGIRLHLDIPGISQAQREERRRTWHSCELLDSVLSMTFGRPPMLPVKSAAPLPQMIDDEYLTTAVNAEDGTQPPTAPPRCGYYLAIIKLSHITAEILRLFYFSEPRSTRQDEPSFEDCGALVRLDSALDTWKQELASHICFEDLQEPHDTNNLFTRQAHLLRHRYLYAKVLLFRRIVVRKAASASHNGSNFTTAPTLHDAVTSSCVDKCTLAAEGLLDCIQPNIGTWLIPPAWYTVFVLYTCATIFAVVSLAPSLYSRLATEARRKLLRNWEQCVQCLQEYSTMGDEAAPRCLQILLNTFDQQQGAAQEEALQSSHVANNQREPHLANGGGGGSGGEGGGSITVGGVIPPTAHTADDNTVHTIPWDIDPCTINWMDTFVDWPEDFAGFESTGAREYHQSTF